MQLCFARQSSIISRNNPFIPQVISQICTISLCVVRTLTFSVCQCTFSDSAEMYLTVTTLQQFCSWCPVAGYSKPFCTRGCSGDFLLYACLQHLNCILCSKITGRDCITRLILILIKLLSEALSSRSSVRAQLFYWESVKVWSWHIVCWDYLVLAVNEHVDLSEPHAPLFNLKYIMINVKPKLREACTGFN